MSSELLAKSQGPRTAGATEIARVALGLAFLLGSGSRLEAQLPPCAATPGESFSTLELRLPANRDRIACEVSVDHVALSDPAIDGSSTLEMGFSYLGEGRGPFVAEAEVVFDTTRWPLDPTVDNSGVSIGYIRHGGWPFDGAPPVDSTYRLTLRDGIAEWSRWNEFQGAGNRGVYAMGMEWVGEAFTFPILSDLRIRLVLRRLPPGPCAMTVEVESGQGAGAYSGDVAVYGDPTGVGADTLSDMSNASQWMQEMVQSEAAREQMAASGATEQQMRQIQELYSRMGGADHVDIGDELAGMTTLTLQDVRFDRAAPTSGLEALMRMAGHFVLAAQVESAAVDSMLEQGRARGPIELRISSMGAKLPSLGLANTETAQGRCEFSGEQKLTLEACPGHDWISRDGPFCGHIEDASLCDEQNREVKIKKAEFTARTEAAHCMF